MGLLLNRIFLQIAPGANPADPATWTSRWVNIGTFVRYATDGGRGIRIVQGKRNEGGGAETASMTLALNNRDGRFTPSNPMGQWFGLLRRGTPIRVILDVPGDTFRTRFQGYVYDWPVKWSKPMNVDSWVTIHASGTLRRLRQGEEQLQSALRRFVPRSTPHVVSYWTLEDEHPSQFAQEIPNGGGPAITNGGVDFAAIEKAGSKALPRFNPGSSFWMSPAQFVYTGAGYRVDWLWRMDDDPGGARTLLRVQDTGTFYEYRCRINSSTGQAFVQVRDEDLAEIVVRSAAIDISRAIGAWLSIMLRVVLVGSSAAIQFQIRRIDAFEDEGIVSETLVDFVDFVGGSGHTIGWPHRVGIGRMLDGASRYIGHIVVSSNDHPTDAHPYSFLADQGFITEHAAQRILRLCLEENVPLTLTGDAEDSVQMGPQPIGTFTSQVEQCAVADGGILYEANRGGFLGYVVRNELLRHDGSFKMEMDLSQLGGEPPEPKNDDLLLANHITGVMPSGRNLLALDEESIALDGRFPDTLNVNVARGQQLRDLTHWRLHLGAFSEDRWPRLTVELHRPDAQSLILDWISMSPGDRVKLDHDISQMPGAIVEQILMGWTETIDQFTWTVEMNLEPARPWAAFMPGDTDRARATTNLSELGSGINSSTTSLSVVSDGRPWINSTDHGAMFPFDIMVGGERMTVTAVSSATSPQTFTVTRSVNGVTKSHDAETKVELADPNYFAPEVKYGA